MFTEIVTLIGYYYVLILIIHICSFEFELPTLQLTNPKIYIHTQMAAAGRYVTQYRVIVVCI